ncbi:MAG: MerR family DNA-binding protein [Agarilytica sp.]
MRVNELAKTLSVSPETIRFYTRKGYLSPVKSPTNGYKEYGPNEQARMGFILSARALGFTVNDIGEILAVADAKNAPCPVVRLLIEQRLAETEAQFQETKRLRDRMRVAVDEWRSLPDKAPTGHMLCHLIEEFMIKEDE